MLKYGIDVTWMLNLKYGIGATLMLTLTFGAIILIHVLLSTVSTEAKIDISLWTQWGQPTFSIAQGQGQIIEGQFLVQRLGIVKMRRCLIDSSKSESFNDGQA